MLARRLAEERREGLERGGIGEAELSAFRARTHVRVITPGSTRGSRCTCSRRSSVRSSRWDTDREAARTALSAAISLVLRLLGRDPDPAKSREHVLLSVLAERQARGRRKTPSSRRCCPTSRAAARPRSARSTIDAFMPKRDRGLARGGAQHAARLARRSRGGARGAPLDVDAVAAPHGRPHAATILSVAHLDDEERALVLGVVLEEVLAWVRTLPGSQRLRALIVFDEVYGFLPPHPGEPADQAPPRRADEASARVRRGRRRRHAEPDGPRLPRAEQRGRVVHRAPPDRRRSRPGARRPRGRGRPRREGDRDRRQALSDDAEAAASSGGFVVRDAQADDGASMLLQPRWAMSWLRGPMTRHEIRRARGA
jgi:hypothetical protein